MKNRIDRRSLAGLAFATLAFGACGAGQAAAQTAEPIRFGMLGSMTGGAAALGANALAGTKLAIAEINAAGGLLGRKVELTIGDDATDPTAAVNETRRLVSQQKIDVLVGPSISQFVLAGLPVLNEAKIASISTGGSTLLNPQSGPYHFSMIYNSEEAANKLVDQALDVAGAKSLGILVDNGAQSKSAAEAMKLHIAARNAKLAGTQEYQYNTSDMTPQLLSLKRDGADALLFFTVSPSDTAKVMGQRSDLGWDVKIMGNLSLPTFAPFALKAVGPEPFKGVYGQIYTGLGYCSNDPMGVSAYAKFRDRLRAADPAMFEKISALGAAYAYDSAMLLAAAIKGAGTTEGPKLAAWIEENAKNYDAVTARLTASHSSHFLFAPDSLVLADRLNEVRGDGLYRRVGC